MRTSWLNKVVHARCIKAGRTLCSYGLSRTSFNSVSFFCLLFFLCIWDFGKVDFSDFIYFRLLDVLFCVSYN